MCRIHRIWCQRGHRLPNHQSHLCLTLITKETTDFPQVVYSIMVRIPNHPQCSICKSVCLDTGVIKLNLWQISFSSFFSYFGTNLSCIQDMFFFLAGRDTSRRPQYLRNHSLLSPFPVVPSISAPSTPQQATPSTISGTPQKGIVNFHLTLKKSVKNSNRTACTLIAFFNIPWQIMMELSKSMMSEPNSALQLLIVNADPRPPLMSSSWCMQNCSPY